MLYRQHELTATNVTFVLKVLTSIYNDLRAVNLAVSKMVIIYISCVHVYAVHTYINVVMVGICVQLFAL